MAGVLNGVLSGVSPGKFKIFEGSTDRMDRGPGAPPTPVPPKPPDPTTMQTGVPTSDPYRLQPQVQKAYTDSEAYRLAQPTTMGTGDRQSPQNYGGQPPPQNSFMFPSSRNRQMMNANAMNTYKGV
jgi:hypothetical protein